MRPLENIKAVELGIWFAGPSAGMILGECGADVVKVEPLEGGDPIRGLSLEELHQYPGPINYLLELVNRNKRCIALDLRRKEGREALYRLIRTSDVFVTNIRPSALERLEATPNKLMAENPRLIYGLLTAYGPEGPDRDRPAFDEAGFWARGGFLSFMGEEDCPPTPLHGAMGDLTTGLSLVAGISMALYVREKTGNGQIVDASLLASGMWVAGFDLQTTLFTNRDVLRSRRTDPGNPLYNIYQCADGRWVQFTMPQTDHFWGPLCRAVDRPGLEQDERFNTHQQLMKNSVEAIAFLDEILAKRPLKEWGPCFDKEGLIWAPDYRLSEVIADPQVEANQFLDEVDHPVTGKVKEVGIPFRLRETRPGPKEAAPEWGQHTEEVLQELGYTWDDILRFKEQGVIS